MDDWKDALLALIGIGAVTALGKVLASDEKITGRLLAGRVIIGASLSLSATSLLLVFPSMPTMVLVGIGSAAGILGEQFVECWFRTAFHIPQSRKGEGQK